MKGLTIFVVILAIIAGYFAVNAENKFTFFSAKSKNHEKSEVTPLGTDVIGLGRKILPSIIKSINNKTAEISSFLPPVSKTPKPTSDIQQDISPEEIKIETKNLVSQVIEDIKNLITQPIKQKINETICEK